MAHPCDHGKRPAPTSVVVMQAHGATLSAIAREHGWSRSKLRRVLRDHSIYCFGRVEDFMIRCGPTNAPTEGSRATTAIGSP